MNKVKWMNEWSERNGWIKWKLKQLLSYLPLNYHPPQIYTTTIILSSPSSSSDLHNNYYPIFPSTIIFLRSTQQLSSYLPLTYHPLQIYTTTIILSSPQLSSSSEFIRKLSKSEALITLPPIISLSPTGDHLPCTPSPTYTPLPQLWADRVQINQVWNLVTWSVVII